MAAVLAAVAVCATFTACNGANGTEKATTVHTPMITKTSPDKYTHYLKDYVGRNCGSFGSGWGNQILERYGDGYIYFNIIADDGSYADVNDKNSLSQYIVTGQSVEPNTEIKYVFKTNRDGEEISLIDTQSLEEVDLYVTRLNSETAASTSESKSDEELTTTTVDIETTDDTTMLIREESKITETQETTLVESTIAESDKPTAETLTGIRPEFKEALDSYEAFFDEYCDIMKKYMENPLDMSILTEYYEYIEKAEEMDEKLEALDDSEWSDEETKYYLEVTTRVTTKMLEVYQ